jgi:nucleoside 2-deoxyribosyltransferase
LIAFARALERCRRFGIDVVPLPCAETIYLGRNRSPGTFSERLDTPAFHALLDRLEAEVTAEMARRGPPLCIVGVDSSPCCGVNQTHAGGKPGDPSKRPGRGAFLARFPATPAIDVTTFARYRIYLAAPLFSEAERTYNHRLAKMLEHHCFDVYLPQEKSDKNDTCGRDSSITHRIYEDNLAAIGDADLIVAVCDGADADSGVAWEMGYAAAQGIPVVAIRTDFRRVGLSERVNLMLEESAGFVENCDELLRFLPAVPCPTPPAGDPAR